MRPETPPPMFAKPAAVRLAPAAAPRRAAPQRPALAGAVKSVFANPFLGAGGAAGLLLLSGAALIVLTANPHAGAPKVRVALNGADAKSANVPGLRPGQSPEQLFNLDALAPGQSVALQPGQQPPIAGQAVFVLPQGATVRESAGSGSSAVGASSADLPAAAAQPFRPVGPPLPKAPLAGLTGPGPQGPLPVINGGNTPFSAYRRPFTDLGKPKIALVVGGLGLNASATRAAIERLPPEITLSFVPYADDLQGWVDQARAAGHEVLLDIPMEPVDYPNNDPGPQTLMAGAPGEIGGKLDWLMSRAQGFFGVTNYLGGKFVTSEAGMAAFTGWLKAHGLAFLDDGSARAKGGAFARASADAVIDEQLSAEQIDKALLGLEAKALAKGAAFGSGFAYPVTVEQVVRWTAGLSKRGYQLAPASAITHR